jgi:hypothetical protein
MGTKTERKSASGWCQRRSDRRTLAAQPEHEDVEAQLRELSSGVLSGVNGCPTLFINGSRLDSRALVVADEAAEVTP